MTSTTNFTINTLPTPSKEELIEQLVADGKITFKQALILLDVDTKVRLQPISPGVPYVPTWGEFPGTPTVPCSPFTFTSGNSHLTAIK